MKLDYIYHSGFAIEADGITVIIDYYKDSSEEAPDRGIVHDHLLKKPGNALRAFLAFPPRPLQPRQSFHGRNSGPTSGISSPKIF